MSVCKFMWVYMCQSETMQYVDMRLCVCERACMEVCKCETKEVSMYASIASIYECECLCLSVSEYM